MSLSRFNLFQPEEVTRVSNVPHARFLQDYFQPAKPVVISDLMTDWPAKEKWSLDYLSGLAGDLKVPVYSSKPAVGKSHQHAAAQHLPLRDYVEMLKAGENDLRMFFYNILQNVPAMLEDFNYPDLGIKFFKRLPVLFVGGKGTQVQMHYDIDLANLILCHFGGRKTVLLFAPEQTPFLYKVPFSFSALHSVDFSNPDFERFPALRRARPMVAHLKHGDSLFIPSGYWHYIVYEDIGFSMTLRSMPTDIQSRLILLKNIFITRTIEGVMRKLRGQQWVDRNERLAVLRTHKYLAQAPQRAS